MVGGKNGDPVAAPHAEDGFERARPASMRRASAA